MKTKDFIAMLQKEDPTGEGYIRLPGGGAPWFAEVKEGYWDGPYQYLQLGDEKNFYPYDSVLVTSTNGYKVDIHVIDSNSIIWDENGDMNKIRKRIAYDFGGYSKDRQSEKEKSGWDWIEKEAAKAREFHEESTIEWTQKVVERYFSSDYEVRQPLTSKIGHANCMTAYRGSKGEVLCQGETLAIIESGKFYYETKENYYVWKYDPEKGQKWRL